MGSPERPTLADAPPALAKGGLRATVHRIGDIVLLLVLAPVFLFIYSNLPDGCDEVFESASHWRAKRDCLNYSAPLNPVVYEEEPLAAAALLARGDGYISAAALASRSMPSTVFIPSCWRKFFPKDPSNTPREALLFLHELHSKAAVRLVSVELASSERPYLSLRVFEQNHPNELVHSYTTSTLPLKLSPTSHLRFYAGQLDSADPAHFTIRYVMDGKEGIIHGRLNEIGDGLNFEFPGLDR